jgi:hypothetical protein
MFLDDTCIATTNETTYTTSGENAQDKDFIHFKNSHGIHIQKTRSLQIRTLPRFSNHKWIPSKRTGQITQNDHGDQSAGWYVHKTLSQFRLCRLCTASIARWCSRTSNRSTIQFQLHSQDQYSRNISQNSNKTHHVTAKHSTTTITSVSSALMFGYGDKILQELRSKLWTERRRHTRLSVELHFG